jgi:cystathionine beta-lyase
MPEKNLDFDTVINRYKTKCLKYDFAKKRGYREDVLPLWVADMDFKSSSYIEQAIVDQAKHGIYGYSNIQEGDGFFEAVKGFMKRHHDWDVDGKWHVHSPGVCFAIANAIRAYTNIGDSVIICQPVYYPFSNIITQNNRKLVVNELLYDGNGEYSIDFDDFERKIVKNQVKLFILCNPHNPVGRVWTKDELLKLGEICKKHSVLVFSDEIHFDFIWEARHNIFQEVSDDFKEFTITATSASKSFNLAGLQQANIFIANKKLKDRFKMMYEVSGLDEPNLMGLVATEAAYKYGDEWLFAVKKYIKENLAFAKKYIEENLPGVRLVKTEGTFLLWLDFTACGIDPLKIDDLIINKANLWLDSGRIFGKSGIGFQRINIACSRATLYEALDRIKNCL